jgi:acetylornithine deacetylase/succinyl-diaminopimelate desuccinylase-like protein
LDALTRLLAELVAIPSVNPMGRPVDGSIHLEGRLSDYLERFFKARSIPYQRIPVSPGRDNVLARFESEGSRRTLLYDVHQDTVPVDGMTIPPFTPRVEGGRLHGRGACDVKGSMAAMLTALDRLCRERPPGAASVILACTVDEEFTHTGSSHLAGHALGADLGIVAEPTRLDLVTSHKGATRWKIRTKGVACHSSTPKLGDNAIYRMARVVTALESYAKWLADGRVDSVLGPPSLSVGRIEGGQSVNVVPDWCEIEVDRRVIPGENPLDCPTQAREFLRDALGGLESIEFTAPWVNMPALVSRVEPHDLDVIREIVRDVTGRAPSTGGVPYGTDAGPLSQAGLRCLVFGPGDIAQAHTKDEWIELEQVQQAAEVYYRLARALA